LSFADERDGERRRRPDDSTDGEPSGNQVIRKKKRPPAPEVGHALRSAYQRTLDESIPPEMLDLLGKLG
jgi:hypothetical protein